MKGEQVTDFQVIRFPCLGFPKVDGFRCILDKQPLTSRLGPFPNQAFTEMAKSLLPKGAMLDGEVTCGPPNAKGVLGKTSSGLTTITGRPDWFLWVFDCYDPFIPYSSRLIHAGILVRRLNHERIKMLPYRILENLEQLQAFLGECLADGYEGIITRDPEALYKEGKSTLRQQGMLKIKPFEDFEARITGYYEEMENTNAAVKDKTGKQKRSSAKSGKKPKGTLGGFIGTEVKTGVEVRVGGGFTAAERKAFWLIKDDLVAAGALMECTKQLMGEKDKPRHPNFKRLRPDWDVTE